MIPDFDTMSQPAFDFADSFNGRSSLQTSVARPAATAVAVFNMMCGRLKLYHASNNANITSWLLHYFEKASVCRAKRPSRAFPVERRTRRLAAERIQSWLERSACGLPAQGGPVMRRGAWIGLVGGLLTGPMMLVWLLLYSAMRPNDHLGSTAALGPFMGGIVSTILGAVFGAVGGLALGMNRVESANRRRCVLFGAVLMGLIGTLESLSDITGSPERFKSWPVMLLGMDLLCPILAGIAAGALIARSSNRRPEPND
jgi:hypothetical protein